MKAKSSYYRPCFQSGSDVPGVSGPLKLLLLGPVGQLWPLAVEATGSQRQTPGLELHGQVKVKLYFRKPAYPRPGLYPQPPRQAAALGLMLSGPCSRP